MPRPYRPGAVRRGRNEDDGSRYDAAVEGSKREIRDFCRESTRPIDIGRADLARLPVAVIYNPTSGKGRNIRRAITTKLEANGISSQFYQTERYMHAWELASTEIDFS